MNRRTSLHYVGLTLLCSLIVPSANGQRQEVGILGGAVTPSGQISVSSLASVSGGVTPAIQVSYAFRVVGTETSNLYVELPVSRVAKASLSVNEREAGASASQVFFTPGVRFNCFVSKHVSPYLMGGAGIGWFDSADVRVDPALSVSISSGLKPAVAFGGGAAFRLARFITFRLEMRDYVAVGSFAGNRNHVTYFGGVGLTF